MNLSILVSFKLNRQRACILWTQYVTSLYSAKFIPYQATVATNFVYIHSFIVTRVEQIVKFFSENFAEPGLVT